MKIFRPALSLNSFQVNNLLSSIHFSSPDSWRKVDPTLINPII